MTMLRVKLNSAHHRQQHNCCQAGCLFHSSVGSTAQSLLPAQGTCQGSAQALTDAFKQLLLISSAGNGRCRLAQGKCLLQSASGCHCHSYTQHCSESQPCFLEPFLYCTPPPVPHANTEQIHRHLFDKWKQKVDKKTSTSAMHTQKLMPRGLEP